MTLRQGILTASILAFAFIGPSAAYSEEQERAVAECPAYADHLRSARAYLEHSDRSNALAELRRARESLEACQNAQADETALAACATSIRTGSAGSAPGSIGAL